MRAAEGDVSEAGDRRREDFQQEETPRWGVSRSRKRIIFLYLIRTGKDVDKDHYSNRRSGGIG